MPGPITFPGKQDSPTAMPPFAGTMNVACVLCASGRVLKTGGDSGNNHVVELFVPLNLITALVALRPRPARQVASRPPAISPPALWILYAEFLSAPQASPGIGPTLSLGATTFPLSKSAAEGASVRLYHGDEALVVRSDQRTSWPV